MCPILPRSRTFLSMLDFYPLIRTSREYTAAVVRPSCSINENEIIKCIECYTTLSPSEKENYYWILRHYIHLNYPEWLGTCNACSLILVTLRAVTTCSECPRVLERFLVFLGMMEEQS